MDDTSTLIDKINTKLNESTNLKEIGEDGGLDAGRAHRPFRQRGRRRPGFQRLFPLDLRVRERILEDGARRPFRIREGGGRSVKPKLRSSDMLADARKP